MAIGRGGFGNHMEAQRERTMASEDVEAQLKEVKQQQDQATASERPAEYAFKSRGGAGNWYSPKELVASGKFESGQLAQDRGVSNPAPEQASPYVRVGRGGSGNFAYADDQAQKNTQQTQADDDEKRRKIQADVAQDVEGQLAFPAKVRKPAVKSNELLLGG